MRTLQGFGWQLARGIAYIWSASPVSKLLLTFMKGTYHACEDTCVRDTHVDESAVAGKCGICSS